MRTRKSVLLFLLFLAVDVTSAQTQYYLYDELGRLNLASMPDGSAIFYDYDANGNVAYVQQWGASTPIIASFSPATGQAGVQVSIQGTGFDLTPSQNAVTFGGVAATVSSATETSLVVTVPLGANSGPIGITVGAAGSSSNDDFTVLKPTIDSFYPLIVNPTDEVSMLGANLNLDPGSTSISISGNPVTITALSSYEAVFDAPTQSGQLFLTSSYGNAVSDASLIVVPSPIDPLDVVDVSEIEVDGEASLTIDQQGASGVLEFDATQGQWLRVRVTSLQTTPVDQAVSYQVYSPTGSTIKTGTIVGTALAPIFLPKIATTGTHYMAFNSVSSTEINLTAVLEPYPELDPAESGISGQTILPNEIAYFTFQAQAGDTYSLALTGFSVTPGIYAYVRVYRPSGSQWESVLCHEDGCSIELRNASQTGTYEVVVDPYSANATMSYTMTLSEHIDGGSLVLDTPTSVSISIPGQRAEYTFDATAGQAVTLNTSAVSTTPAGKPIYLQVLNPGGSEIHSGTQSTVNLTGLAAGTHTVIVAPVNGATATLNLLAASGVSDELPVDGTTQSYSTTVPDQRAYFTFDATAGDDLNMAITGITVSPGSYVYYTVNRPSGSYWVSSTLCSESANPGCSRELRNASQTGTYKVTVWPYSAGATMNLSMTMSENLDGGSLVLGTPTTVNIPVVGQRAEYTFDATAGQAVVLNTSSVSTTPSGKPIRLTVYNPSGTQIHNGAQSTINLDNLNAGTHTIIVAPSDGATGTLDLLVANGISEDLPVDGTTQSYSTTVPEQMAYFTFDATAGDDLNLAITGMSVNPGSYVYVNVNRPSGSYWVSSSLCSESANPGCSYELRNASQTGTYKVRISPYSAGGTMNLSMTMSENLDAGTLVLDTPTNVTISNVGQRAEFEFTATQGQNAMLTLNSLSMTPSGASVKMQVLNPGDSQIATATTSTSTTINLSNLAAGTHKVVLSPTNAATGSMTVELE